MEETAQRGLSLDWIHCMWCDAEFIAAVTEVTMNSRHKRRKLLRYYGCQSGFKTTNPWCSVMSLRKSYSKSRFKYSHILFNVIKWISVNTFRFNTATSIVFVFFDAGTATVGVIVKSIVCALAFVLIWQLYGEKNVTAVVVCMQISQCSTVLVLLLTWKWACIFHWVQTTSLKIVYDSV